MVSRPVRRLAALIRGIESAMFITINSDGSIHSRPMVVQDFDFDGSLWFYTYKGSGKIEAIQSDSRVCVTFMDPNSNRYISVSGTAQVHTDEWTMKKMWAKAFARWFPEGPNHPDLALIQMHVQQAEAWDAPHSDVVEIIHFTSPNYKSHSHHSHVVRTRAH